MPDPDIFTAVLTLLEDLYVTLKSVRLLKKYCKVRVSFMQSVGTKKLLKNAVCVLTISKGNPRVSVEFRASKCKQISTKRKKNSNLF